MYLVLDTNESRFALVPQSGGDLEWREVGFDESLPRELQSAYTGNYDGIFLVQGRGGFSQTREGVVTANLLGMLQQIPLRELQEEELALSVDAWLSKDPQPSFKAEYYTEPNIS